MKTTVTFEHVYKQYNLGLSRTSLPALMSRWLKQPFNGRSTVPATDRTLWALDDVNFELKEGESLALVGANGAGKTTILKLLANITKPTSGAIHMHGRLSALIELGAGFHPDLTGRENVYLNGTILGLSRQEIASRFDEIVAFSELERFIDTPVKRYSSGMTVRLGFAVASCIESDILLVDEVLAVGDTAFQQKCLKRIQSLCNNGTSIIFVSHNFYLVQAVCNVALYLQKGRVKHYGKTSDVIAMYEQDLHLERAQKFAINVDVRNVNGTNHGGIHAGGQGGNDRTMDRIDDGIEIIKVEVIQTDGSVPDVWRSNQSAHIRIHYRAYQPLGRLQASAFIIRSDGLTCCMMRTRLEDFCLVVEAGEGLVSLQIEPLQLVGGTYFVEAWFLNEEDSMVLTSSPGRSDWFVVKGAALSYEESSGIFEPNVGWTHYPDYSYANGNGVNVCL